MKNPRLAAATVITISFALTWAAVANWLWAAHAPSQMNAILDHCGQFGTQLIGGIRARRFLIEAILLALVAGLHLALLMEGRPPGQKLRRVELSIISLYLAVITLNVVSVCVDTLGGVGAV